MENLESLKIEIVAGIELINGYSLVLDKNSFTVTVKDRKTKEVIENVALELSKLEMLDLESYFKDFYTTLIKKHKIYLILEISVNEGVFSSEFDFEVWIDNMKRNIYIENVNHSIKHEICEIEYEIDMLVEIKEHEEPLSNYEKVYYLDFDVY